MTDKELIDHLAGLVECVPDDCWCLGDTTIYNDIGDRLVSGGSRELMLYIAACNPENMKRLLELAESALSMRKAIEQFADPHSWHMNGICDPNGRNFKGIQIAVHALQSQENSSE